MNSLPKEILEFAWVITPEDEIIKIHIKTNIVVKRISGEKASKILDNYYKKINN